MKRRSFLEQLSIAGGTGFSLGFSPKIKAIDAVTNQSQPEKDALVSIQVTAPSTIHVNEPFWIGIRLLTKPYFTNWEPSWNRSRATVNGPFNVSSRGIHFMNNVVPHWDNEIEIISDKDLEGITRYSFKEGSGPYENDQRPIRRLEGFRFKEAGIKYIKIKDPITGITGISNAIVVTQNPPKQRLYWGNLHCHSIFGDGVRIPEEIYAFAKDESFLDVFALTDHTEAITKAQWSYFKEVTNDFNEKDRFVTFIGGEWTSPQFGHRNFIYPGDDGQILRSSDPKQNTLPKLFEAARQNKCLLIANHTASGGHTTKWENGHDPEIERLIEVYSIGGINEMMFGMHKLSKTRAKENEVEGSHVLDGLKRGFKLGMIGTGDDHDGRPGDSLHHLQEKPESYKFMRGPGLMGVWAQELSRESIFDALWNRHVFGTTNNRTYLKFTINERIMGSEITTNQDLSVEIEVASNLFIERIDFLMLGEVTQSTEPQKEATFWHFTIDKVTSPTWFYTRIKLAEDHFAWSSPIWVNPV